jgi:hypothetical protein
MYRRILMGLLGAAVLALAAAPTQGQDKDKVAPPHAHGPHAICARACADCALHCDSCFHHCAHLVVEGKKDHAAAAVLCNDCATVCGAAAHIVGRHGPLSVTICESCAKSCDVCAESCEKFPSDEHMAACAKSCRACAKACREMITHVGHGAEKKAP